MQLREMSVNNSEVVGLNPCPVKPQGVLSKLDLMKE